MPDITMCGSITCPLRYNCYRSQCSGTQPKEFRQSYFIQAPYDADKQDCAMYLSVAEVEWDGYDPDEDN